MLKKVKENNCLRVTDPPDSHEGAWRASSGGTRRPCGEPNYNMFYELYAGAARTESRPETLNEGNGDCASSLELIGLFC